MYFNTKYFAVMAICFLISSFTLKLIAQSENVSPITANIYGFVRNDMNYDSRQNVVVREGQLDLFPKDKEILSDGSDFNAQPQLSILGILARFGVKATGPDAFKAKTTAVLEGDFFGQADPNIGLLRLRHGYVKMDWSKTNLTFGQTWYPMFIPECFPAVVNFNTGIPIAPFGWAGQMKIVQKLTDKLNIAFTAYKPREFGVFNVNPADGTNAASLNAAMPELNLHLQYKSDKFLIGAQADYGELNPNVKYGPASALLVSNERVRSFSFMAYSRLNTSKLIVKAQFVQGQNLAHTVMMGGYFGYRADPEGIETYKPASNTAAWIELIRTSKKITPGLWIGYSSNNGADSGATAAYGRAIGVTGRGIKDLFRISPRLDFVSGKLTFRNEFEITNANYGVRGNDGRVSGDTDAITNYRFTFSTIFNF
jgi:hypothetical protein